MKMSTSIPKHSISNLIAFTYFTYGTYLVIFAAVAIRDYLTNNLYDSYFEMVAFSASLIGLYRFHRTRNLTLAREIAVWIAYLLIFALLYTSRFDHFVSIYVVIAPLVAYFMFTLPVALYNLAAFYTILLIEIVILSADQKSLPERSRCRLEFHHLYFFHPRTRLDIPSGDQKLLATSRSRLRSESDAPQRGSPSGQKQSQHDRLSHRSADAHKPK
jgi:hypothetical protein